MLSWQLHYPDGKTWEPLPGVAESIRDARPGATLLVIVAGSAALGSIELRSPTDRPVFYRFRALEFGPGASEEPAVLATIFGRATPDAERCELWTYRDGEFVQCPPELLDVTGVRTCLGLN